ncbi:MAG: SUMF1/EgtB/PvdO family nonheme iron enzyme, partial [Planctomycetales bacterium]|nr:SUMF1/EgtB/PvdO family nonheme iron enzyme [Planctomycetales bacterium]
MSTTTAPPGFSLRRVARAIDAEVILGAGGGVLLLAGLATQQAVLQGAGAAGLCMACRNLIARGKADKQEAVESPAPPVRESRPEPSRRSPAKREAPIEEADEDIQDDLVAQMIEDKRYALLLRPETACQLEREEHIRAIRALDDDMVLTPAGLVLVGLAAERETLGHEVTTSLMKSGEECLATVEACYLDRFPVTNADFQRFVDAGGYEEIQYWPEEALPALFDFVDETGIAAPRYWREGAYPEGDGDLPVVGVSWYEALAYARWVGKRLPNDAEWTKACAWPIEAAPGP